MIAHVRKLLPSGLLCALALFAGSCGSTSEEEDRSPQAANPAGDAESRARSENRVESPTQGPFFDQAAELSLDFSHFNGMSGALLYSEMMGSGAAFFDADGDGDLDVYLVQGALLGDGVDYPDTLRPPAENDRPPRDRLYLNQLEEDSAGLSRPRLVDVTDASGLEATGYGMGVTVFDADGDGRLDLYLTNAGPNQLWRNLGNRDGTPRFEEIGRESRTALEAWSVPAVPFDYDRDGRLDLFVGNYLDYRPSADKPCTDELGQRNYCGPLAYPPVADKLLRNVGNDERGRPRFEDVSRRAGLESARPGGCLGAIAADFDGDGWSDLYVGNDGTPNHLWINRGPAEDGSIRFEEQAVLAGVAVNGMGHPEASMGIAAADLDHDGDEDLFVTHLNRETNTLYLNDGRGFFSDVSDRSGLGPPSLPLTGFGTAFLDYDRDGWLDTVVVNGAVKIIKSQALAGEPFPLHQPNQLFRHLGEPELPRFEVVGFSSGVGLASSEVSRGLAVGDVDNDGDPDLLINNNNAPARLLVNRSTPGRPWLGLRLLGRGGSDALGARAAVVTGKGRSWRRVQTAGSYASSHDPRLLFALDDDGPARIEVIWPDGGREEWTELAAGRYHTLVRGQGRASTNSPQSTTAEDSP